MERRQASKPAIKEIVLSATQIIGQAYSQLLLNILVFIRHPKVQLFLIYFNGRGLITHTQPIRFFLFATSNCISIVRSFVSTILNQRIDKSDQSKNKRQTPTPTTATTIASKPYLHNLIESNENLNGNYNVKVYLFVFSLLFT